MLSSLARVMFSSSTIQPRRQNSERSDDQDCSAWYVLLFECLCSRRGKIYKSTLLLSLYVLGRIVAFGFFIYGDINKRAQTFRRLKLKIKREIIKHTRNLWLRSFSFQESTESLTNLHISPVRGSHGDLSVRSDSSSPMTFDSG